MPCVVESFNRDHPRVCGKDRVLEFYPFVLWGSPPRMRERHFIIFIRVHRNRITPAYAGKTSQTEKLDTLIRDHPRVCGKDSFRASVCLFAAGSPPRMRERRRVLSVRRRFGGITPAYAGKTLVVGGVDILGGDHPRVCGKDEPVCAFCERM